MHFGNGTSWGCCKTAPFLLEQSNPNPNPSPIEKRFGFSLLRILSGSPPGRRSYGPRNRGLTKAPLGLWLRHKCRRPVQVLLSAVECFQKDYCKRKETAFLESCRPSGSPPGRRSYRPRNRALTNSPLGCWLPRLRRGRAVQVLLSAQKEKLSTLC